MAPKEKAKEIVNNMHDTEHCGIKHFPNNSYCDCTEMNLFQAKQCALISVDQILKVLNDDIYIQGETDIDSHIAYWKAVKKELEML